MNAEGAEGAEEWEELLGSKNQERGGGAAGESLESKGRRRSVCSKGCGAGNGEWAMRNGEGESGEVTGAGLNAEGAEGAEGAGKAFDSKGSKDSKGFRGAGIEVGVVGGEDDGLGARTLAGASGSSWRRGAGASGS
jgi:hypothetical protein